VNKISSQAKRLSKDIDCHYEQVREQIIISITTGQRSQKITVARFDQDYILTSVVLGATKVQKTPKRWRELARLAWHRNAEHQLVTFAFDRKDRLVGQIRHPVDHLDYEELKIYVCSLARECDRFEYLLSGDDEF
jgi:hypothetical protein